MIGSSNRRRLVRDDSAAASVPDAKATWETTYQQKIADSMKSNLSDCKWDLMDLDNDGIPELFISTLGDGYDLLNMYYYNNGVAMQVPNEEYFDISYVKNGQMVVCPGAQLISCVDNSYYETHIMWKYENHIIKKVQTMQTNANIAETETPWYTINDVKVSKEEYDAAVELMMSKNWSVVGRHFSLNDLSPLN